jgi:hypothetical protein
MKDRKKKEKEDHCPPEEPAYRQAGMSYSWIVIVSATDRV